MQKIAAALVSVGGAPAPVLHVLRQHRPAHVWYFCSGGSRPNADDIQGQLDWHPQARFIEVERFEELGPCYGALRRAIPGILAETKVRAEEVLVDYTGGTKTMSAALVLAGIELFQRFSYVGGEQRERTGLGVVIDGKERTLYQDNPWAQLAIREIERARVLWDACQFETAAQVLRAVAPRVPKRLRFEAIARLAEGLAARHRLDFSNAVKLLKETIGRLRPIFEAHPTASPLPCAEEALEVCEACTAEAVGPRLLRELLDNTLRTAAQGRYEDAAARLYRAMEMQGQLWLAEATGGLFVNGRCKAEKVGQLPSELAALPFCRPGDAGEIRIGLEQTFQALAALGHKQAATIAADTLGGKSRFRQATEKRNAGILAHGVVAVGVKGFDQMKEIAAEFLGFDLDREAHPIPVLNPWWFE